MSVPPRVIFPDCISQNRADSLAAVLFQNLSSSVVGEIDIIERYIVIFRLEIGSTLLGR